MARRTAGESVETRNINMRRKKAGKNVYKMEQEKRADKTQIRKKLEKG